MLANIPLNNLSVEEGKNSYFVCNSVFFFDSHFSATKVYFNADSFTVIARSCRNQLSASCLFPNRIFALVICKVSRCEEIQNATFPTNGPARQNVSVWPSRKWPAFPCGRLRGVSGVSSRSPSIDIKAVAFVSACRKAPVLVVTVYVAPRGTKFISLINYLASSRESTR